MINQNYFQGWLRNTESWQSWFLSEFHYFFDFVDVLFKLKSQVCVITTCVFWSILYDDIYFLIKVDITFSCFCSCQMLTDEVWMKVVEYISFFSRNFRWIFSASNTIIKVCVEIAQHSRTLHEDGTHIARIFLTDGTLLLFTAVENV